MGFFFHNEMISGKGDFRLNVKKKIPDCENYWITEWSLKGRGGNFIRTALGIGLLVKLYSFSKLTALTCQQQSQIIHGSPR